MMHESDRTDLSPLDPARDEAHWSALLAATRLRVAAVLARRRPRDPLDFMSEWSRPILAAAATLLLLLGGAGAMQRDPAPVVSDARQLARLSRAAVVEGRAPTGAQLAAALQSRSRP